MARLLPPLLLLLLLGTLDSGLVQGNDCNNGSETVKEEDREKSETAQLFVGALKVGKDFNGVSLEVRGTNDSKSAWFPKEHCFPQSGIWTQLLAKMEVEGNKITLTLNSGDCLEKCTINSNLSGNFFVVLNGSALWRKSLPKKYCKKKELRSFPSAIPESTCREFSSTASNWRKSKGSELPLWALVLMVVIIVAVVGAIVVFVRWKYETSRNATKLNSEMSEPHISPRVIENDDLYDSLDHSAIETYQSCEAIIHCGTKDGLSPVQGEDRCTFVNDLYDSYSSYGHRLDQ